MAAVMNHPHVEKAVLTGVAQSGSSPSHVVHRWTESCLFPGTRFAARLFASTCGTAVTRGIDQSNDLVAKAKPCKRCFRPHD